MTTINTIINNNTVDSTSDIYDTMHEKWQLPITLMGGEDAMKKAGLTYLPREPLETVSQYNNRLSRSTLKNYFAWAVENHTGRVFKKPIIFSDDTNKLILDYNNNIDLQGNNADAFYKEVFRDMLIKGISYVYVDYPNSGDDLTLADELDASFRPYCVHIKAEQVINAVPGVINSRKVLIRAHILEIVTVPDGVWGVKTIQQIRVLYPGSWQLFREDDKNNWILFDEGETSLNYIPLVPLYGKKIGFFGSLSPLQNLANLNRAHWQSLSDQMNITHVARVPILFGTGFNEGDTLPIGAKSAVMGPDGSDLQYVEHTGKAIEAGMQEIRDLEDRMMVESLELLNAKNPSGTATAKALDISDINCSLQDLAVRLQGMIIKVNNIMCDWEDIEKSGKAIVNVDFGLQLRDGSESNVLLKMRQNRSISLPSFHKEMKRRGVLSPDFDSSKDIELLKQEKIEEELPESKPYIDENGKQVVGTDEEENLETGKPRIE